MPIYEYHCRTCKKDFEILQKISNKPIVTCPTCGKRIKRIISQTNFTLKGGGWYKDGYSKSSTNSVTTKKEIKKTSVSKKDS